MIARPTRGSRFATVAPWVSTVFRLALGGVLLAAGGLKAVDPANSVQALRAYEILPESVVTIVGWGLPFLEIALGLVLIAGVFVRYAALVTGIALIAFIAAVASVAARGLTIDCGCFGGGGQVLPSETAYTREIVRDFGFLLMAAWLVWRPQSKFALERDERSPGEHEEDR